MKPTQATGPNLPTKRREQKQEKLQPYNLEKGDLNHSTVDKIKSQRNIVQMKKQGK